jgi:hypothetical protein
MAASSNPANNVILDYGSMWEKSLASAIEDTPNILQKVAEFINIKSANPMAQFGTNDKPFTSEGIYKQHLPKARKARLTQDISIVYELSGRNPTIIKMYGVFTHAMLGTGQSPKLNIQRNMSRALAGSFNESLEVFLHKLLQE